MGETTVRCARADLERARFAKGALAPKGLLYFLTTPPDAPDWAHLGRRALARTARIMLAPLPFVGVLGMRMLARRIERLPLADGGVSARLYIGNIVRMQEEIGTGGGGFRFLYASPRPATPHSKGSRRAWSRSATAGASSRSLARA